VKCKIALTSQQHGWCVLEFHKTNSVVTVHRAFKRKFNPLNTELNPICHLLALLGAYPVLHVSRIRVNVDLLTNKYILK
jgi:hypothetical protein